MPGRSYARSSAALSMIVALPLVVGSVWGCALAPAVVAQDVVTGISVATQLYGIAKGVAQQAELADPAIAPKVAQVEAQAEPIAAAVTTATAPQLATLAQTLLVAAAPVVHVEPNTTAPVVAPVVSAPTAAAP